MRIITLIFLFGLKCCTAQFRILGVLGSNISDEQTSASDISIVKLETFLNKSVDLIVPRLQLTSFSDSVPPSTNLSSTLENKNIIKFHVIDSSTHKNGAKREQQIEKNANEIIYGLEGASSAESSEVTENGATIKHYQSKFFKFL